MTVSQLVDADEAVVHDLQQKLIDSNTTLPEKYRVLFSLRNVKGAAAYDALELGVAFMFGVVQFFFIIAQ